MGVRAMLVVAAVLMMAVDAGAQAKPSFAGEWKIAGAPDSGSGRSAPGVDLTITQSATSMTVEYRAGAQGAPLKLTCNLDGSPSRNAAADGGGERVSKATWIADKLVVSTTTDAGEEKRTFSMAGDRLVVETWRGRRRAEPRPQPR